MPKSAPLIGGFGFARRGRIFRDAALDSAHAVSGCRAGRHCRSRIRQDISFYLLALPLYDDIVDIVIGILCLTIAALGRHRHDGRRERWRSSIASPRRWRFTRREASWCCRRGRGGGRTGRPGYGRAWCSERCCASHPCGQPVLGPLSPRCWTDIRRWLPAPPMPTSISGYPATTSWSFVGSWPRSCWRWRPAVPRVRAWLLLRRSHWLVPLAALALLFVGAFVVPAGVEDTLCRPEPDHPRAALSASGASPAPASLQSRRAVGRGARVRGLGDAVDAPPTSTRTPPRCRTPASGIGARSNRNSSRSRACGRITPFAGVDIDRYQIDGAERQVMITARELDVARLPAPAKVWVNLALKYTHGYGVVAVPVNEIDARGNPVLWAHDIPVKAKGDLAVTQGADLFRRTYRRPRLRAHHREGIRLSARPGQCRDGVPGQRRNSAVQLLAQAGRRPRIRRPAAFHFRIFHARRAGCCCAGTSSSGSKRSRHSSSSIAIPISSPTAIIIPIFSTPIPARQNYPYSDAYQGSLPAFHGRNYLRNSVKAVIDAYNGSVTFYVFDRHDPIIKAYRRMLPGLFKDARRDAGKSAPPHPLSGGPLHRAGRDVRHLPHDQPHYLLQSRGPVGGAARALSQ